MTALEAIAQREATVTYDAARKRHELAALKAHRAHKPLTEYLEAAAAQRLAKFAPSETVVVREIGDVLEQDHRNREGWA